MPVQVMWDDADKTILMIQFIDGWTWDEYYPARQKAREMTIPLERQFYVVMDFSIGDKHLPPHLVTNFRKDAINTAARSKGLVVVTNQLYLARVFFEIFSNLSGSDHAISIVPTLKDAQLVLAKGLEKSKV